MMRTKFSKKPFWFGVEISVFVVLLLWLIHGAQYLLDIDLRNLGIYPRSLGGSVGILTGGLVHNDAIHLFSNTFPLLMLGTAIYYFYRPFALQLIVILYMLTGAFVWLFARDAYHIGASGLIYGMIGFLLCSGFLRRDPQSMGISLAFLFLYGGVLQGMFPAVVESNVSWESHLLGAVAGGMCAFIFRKRKGPELPGADEPDDGEDNIDFTSPGNYRYNYKD